MFPREQQSVIDFDVILFIFELTLYEQNESNGVKEVRV